MTALNGPILFDAAGSDSQASGCGPSTAVFGTGVAGTGGAHTNGVSSTTITFDGVMSLATISVGDLLYLNTSSGRKYTRISSIAGIGSRQVVVENSFNIASGSAVAFAVGGKRLSFAGSSQLFSDAYMDWQVEATNDQTLTATLATAITGVSGAAGFSITYTGVNAYGQLTQSGSGLAIINAASDAATKVVKFVKWQFRHSHATKQYAIQGTDAQTTIIENCVCGADDGTNCPFGLFTRTGGAPTLVVRNSKITRGSGHGLTGAVVAYLSNVEISRMTGNGILDVNGLRASKCLVVHNGGEGIRLAASSSVLTIVSSTVCNNAGDGIEIDTDQGNARSLISRNNVANNGGYGIKATAGNTHLTEVSYNNFYLNSAGASSNITLDSTNSAIDPQFTDNSASVRNYLPTNPLLRDTDFGGGEPGRTQLQSRGVVAHAHAA